MFETARFIVTPSIPIILYTVLSRRSLGRIIMMSKCPAQGTTMFPRRHNILFVVSKPAAAAFSLFHSLPVYHIYALKFAYDDKEQSAIGLTLFARHARGKAHLCESLWLQRNVEDKLLKFMYIYRTWITLYRPYFLNGLICSSLSNSAGTGIKFMAFPNALKIYSCRYRNVFSPPSTLLTPLRSTENIKDGSEEAQRSPIRRIHTFLSTDNSQKIYTVGQRDTMTVSDMNAFS